MTNTPFNKAYFMISCGYGFMGSSTLQQQAIHLVFGTDEGMVREKASGIFAALTEGTNEFSHEILEAACGDSDEAAQLVRQVMEALRTLPFSGAQSSLDEELQFSGRLRHGAFLHHGSGSGFFQAIAGKRPGVGRPASYFRLRI